MQENNFEKGIRQKMEDLSFEPSDPVWQKVEMQIQQKRRRRRLALFLLPLLLAGGAFTWYLATNTNNNVTTVATENKPAQTKSTTPVINERETTQEVATESKEKINLLVQKEKETLVIGDVKSTPTHQKEKETFAGKTKNEKKVRGTIIEDEEGFFESELHALILQNEIDKKEGKKADEQIDNPFKKKESEWQKNLSNLAIINSELNKEIVQADSTAQAEIAAADNKTDSSTTSNPIKVKGKRDVWQWSLHARVGVSGLRSNVTDVFGGQREADFAAAPSTGNNQPPRIAPGVNNHVAYTIGATVRRKLAASAFVGLGLQYSYYSTQSNVGTTVNRDTIIFYNGRQASLSNYYSNTGAAKLYKSRYHYIELPLTIDYAPFKNVPLQLQHGVSMGYLVASNALVQSSSSGIYFRSDEVLRKTGFNLFTSFDYRLLKTRSFSLFAGPQLQWSLTPIQKEDGPNKQHLFFAGLNTQLRF